MPKNDSSVLHYHRIIIANKLNPFKQLINLTLEQATIAMRESQETELVSMYLMKEFRYLYWKMLQLWHSTLVTLSP